MPSDPYFKLEQVCRRIARRRPDWPSQLGLVNVNTVEDVIATIRADSPDPIRSDSAIRALAAQSDIPDVATVLLHALTKALLARLNPSVTTEFRADALGDLTFVVFDATGRDELDRCTGLAQRLANRAHNRTHKHTRLASQLGSRGYATVDPIPPDRFAQLDCGISNANDEVADTAIVRADLGAFAAAVQQAIEDGDLQPDIWEDVRDHRLKAQVIDVGYRTNRERAATSRHARLLDQYVQAHLFAA